MSYRDINDYLAEEKDWLCTRCDMPLDRIGSHCKSCMVELQEEIDHLEAERVSSTMANTPVYSVSDTVKFLDDAFQKIFKTRE